MEGALVKGFKDKNRKAFLFFSPSPVVLNKIMGSTIKGVVYILELGRVFKAIAVEKNERCYFL